MGERVYACERPEAPPDGLWFHTRAPCRPCLVAVTAAAANYPGHVNSRGKTIEQILARAQRANDAAHRAAPEG